MHVDGRTVVWPLRRVDPRHETVTVDGRPVGDRKERLVLALHKPAGYITSRTDPRGRPTVYDLLVDFPEWVFPVGRLDRDSSGLLILTNDHRLGHRLTDPGHHVPKTYHVEVEGIPSPEVLDVLAEGVPLEDGLTRPAGVRPIGAPRGGATWLEIILTEGRNRQIRRMCAALGHDVRTLVRVAIGPLRVGDLPSGAYRALSTAEVDSLQRAHMVGSAP